MIRASVRALIAATTVFGLAGFGTAEATGLPTEWQVGGIVLVAPKYEGSKDYEVLGFPLAIPAGLDDGRSRFSFKGVDDIRFRLLEQYGFELGPIAGWRFGRDEKDGDKLTGLGDIDGGLVVGGYVGYRFGSALASVSYGHQVTGEDNAGGLVRFALENKFRPAKGWTVTGTVGTTWADSDYMSTFFDVPVAKVIAGRPAFDAEAGFKDVNLTLASDLELDRNWTLKLIGRYSRLVGDAADSPVVETANQFYGGVGLTYRFDFGSVRR
jgi:outer membrane scaffolding protein for murein synthesis (MipA/OmpV family)